MNFLEFPTIFTILIFFLEMQYEKTDGPTNGGTDGQMYRGTDVRTVFYSNYIYRLKVREA